MTREFKMTIGADPEFFVIEGTGKDAKAVMACGKFGGGKGAPILLGDMGGYLEDGTAVEFNLPPTNTLAEMQAKIFALITEFEKQKQVKVSYYTSQAFKADELKKFPEAMAIGCAPDRFAYGLRSAPSIAQFKNRRFAGGHIHVGLDPWPEGLEKVNLIRWLDINILAPFSFMYADQARYPHYGYPGLYRETSYGVEWRSPDNSWCNPVFLLQNKSNDIGRYLSAFISRFDQEMPVLLKVLNKCGDGKRVNEVIETFVNAHGYKDILSSASVRRKPALPGTIRTMYSHLSSAVVRILKEDPNTPKKDKAPQVLADFDDFFVAEGGT